jgi:ferredoxin-nitrate reductase
MAWDSQRVDMNVYSQGEVDRWVYSTCNICSIGCGCYIAVKDNKIVGIKGNGEHPINRGRLDPKSEWQWVPNNSPDRLLHPLIRNRSGKLVQATWDDAMGLFVEKAREVLAAKGPLGISIYHTGQAMLEDYYTIGKIGRAGLRTNLLDANTRLCTATTEWCLIESFGADGVPACYDDVDETETLLLFGHNPAETGSVLFERIMNRKRKTGKPYIIVVDPRRTLTADAADLFLQLYPGTNLALLNGVKHLMLRNGHIDLPFIQQHTVEFEKMRDSVKMWTPELTAQITGIPVDQLHQFAHRLGTTPSLVSTTLQGVFQTSDATGSAVAINNIHLLRGLIGKLGSGPLHMAGQPSSSSNRTVGGVGSYPGHRNPDNKNHIAEIARLWNVEEKTLPIGPEIGIEEQIHMMETDKIGLLWNIHTNPMVSLPNRRRARQAFEKVFVVVQDVFLTETTEVADIVLPAAIWGEKEGTMENADRTVNLLRKAVDPPPGVKTDFAILLDFSHRMGFKDRDGNPLIAYSTPEQCFEEWRMVSRGTSADMSGITYDKLEQHNGLRYPVNEELPLGTVRLYEDSHFHTGVDETQSWGRDMFTGRSHTRKEYEALQANGRAIFHSLTYIPPAERPTPEYPLWITTGRLIWHWHSRTKTGRVPHLHMAAPQGYVDISVKDAEAISILPGEMVRVVSPRGWIQVPARVVDTVQPGLVFVPFHFGSWQQQQAANELTADLTDPVSKQPTFKQSSCRVEKLRKKVVIQQGVALSDIATSHGLTLEQLAQINRIMPPYRADIGREIEVPLSMVDVVIPPYMPYREVGIFPKFDPT